jgi:hypothetical protein
MTPVKSAVLSQLISQVSDSSRFEPGAGAALDADGIPQR